MPLWHILSKNIVSLAKYSKVCLVGWWTGWHVLPIVSLIHQHTDFKIEYFWIGGGHSLEEEEAKREGIRFFRISTLKLSSIFSPFIILYPFITFIGIFQARKVILVENPDIVFSKWWPGSLSVGIAAWLLMKPLWIHESDSVPGLSNRILGTIFAEKIFLGFSTTTKFFPSSKCIVSWQLLNPALVQPPKNFRYWKTTKSHVLVLCGSQWSRNIFRAIANQCRGVDVEWIVVLWKLNTEARGRFHKFRNITLYDWVDPHTLWSILRGCDLAITRWSANTLAELDEFNVRKLIIPLPWSAGNHQYHNAKWYEELRKDIVLEEMDIDRLSIILAKTLSADIIDQSMERNMDFLK